MKKLFTVLCTLAVACAMAMPVYAKKGGKKSEESTEASTKSKGKAHVMHAKKKGATEGKKKGQ